ncbi:MAG: carboxylesterase family protein [Rhodospirillales bacterium]|nr:carboxylesterase family protein [Rhodospirillales bacterium]
MRVDKVFAFLGLPYAAPPVGALRYASPRPPEPWTTPRDATQPGAASIQTLGGAAAWLYEGATPQAEDCLFLNVWTPDPQGQRPVMVWLHGGAWRTGRGNAVGTIGTTLAARGDVVVVTLNYRLGALGWLAHPDLADPTTGAYANWGLQDQIAALQWVQANIAAFGGDPKRVTLFGQSAGGSSTASIAQDPRHAGLLARAIIESGSLHGAPAFPEPATAASYAEALAKRLDTSVAGLRQVPAETLHQTELALARDPTVVKGIGRPPVLPVKDGIVLKTWPRDGTLAPVPLLIGTTRTEATFWYDLIGPDGARVPGLNPPANPEALLRAVADLMAVYRPESRTRPAEVIDAYTDAAMAGAQSLDPLSLWIAIDTDVVFTLRAREAAARHAASGQLTYLYTFDRPLAPPAHGVPHTAEIPFVFGTYGDPFFAAKCGAGPESATLSEFMLTAWARFAHDGALGAPWRAVADVTPPANVLGGPDGLVAPDTSPTSIARAIWG